MAQKRDMEVAMKAEQAKQLRDSVRGSVEVLPASSAGRVSVLTWFE